MRATKKNISREKKALSHNWHEFFDLNRQKIAFKHRDEPALYYRFGGEVKSKIIKDLEQYGPAEEVVWPMPFKLNYSIGKTVAIDLVRFQRLKGKKKAIYFFLSQLEANVVVEQIKLFCSTTTKEAKRHLLRPRYFFKEVLGKASYSGLCKLSFYSFVPTSKDIKYLRAMFKHQISIKEINYYIREAQYAWASGPQKLYMIDVCAEAAPTKFNLYPHVNNSNRFMVLDTTEFQHLYRRLLGMNKLEYFLHTNSIHFNLQETAKPKNTWADQSLALTQLFRTNNLNHLDNILERLEKVDHAPGSWPHYLLNVFKNLLV